MIIAAYFILALFITILLAKYTKADTEVIVTSALFWPLLIPISLGAILAISSVLIIRFISFLIEGLVKNLRDEQNDQ